MIVVLTKEEFNFLQTFEKEHLTIESVEYEKPFLDGVDVKWTKYVDPVSRVVRVGERYLITQDGENTYVEVDVEVF